MRWIFSVNVGITNHVFPEHALRSKLSEQTPESIDIRQNFYPSDGELGMLASIVYEEHRAISVEGQLLSKSQRSTLEREIFESQEARVPHKLGHFFEHWSCVFRFLERDSGYSGAVYMHDSLPQLVLVNEGTRTKEHMIADAREIASSTVGEDTEVSAAVELITQLNAVLMSFPYYAVSFTGHSLGGWLSLVSTLEAEKQRLHVHTVTLDSPGAMPMLMRRQHEVSSDISIATLDIRTILSSVNVVNVCHTHAPGTIRVFPALEGVTGTINYTLEAHAIRHMLELFDEHGQLQPDQCRIVDNWPSIQPPERHIKSRSLLTLALCAAQSLSSATLRESLSDYRAFFSYWVQLQICPKFVLGFQQKVCFVNTL